MGEMKEMKLEPNEIKMKDGKGKTENNSKMPVTMKKG